MKALSIILSIIFLASCGDSKKRIDARSKIITAGIESEKGPSEPKEIENKKHTNNQVSVLDPSDVLNDVTIVDKLPEHIVNANKIFKSTCEQTSYKDEFFFHRKRIMELGGVPTNPFDDNFYPENLEGFQYFLDRAEITSFKAKDLVKGNESHLNSCGLENLLPPKKCWSRVQILLQVAQNISKATGEKLQVNSLYRPKCYNDQLMKVNSDAGEFSDHILSRAVDISLEKGTREEMKAAREKIQVHLCETLWQNDRFNTDYFFLLGGEIKPSLSVGLGTTKVHIGIDSPKGKRVWSYNGAAPLKLEESSHCFDPALR